MKTEKIRIPKIALRLLGLCCRKTYLDPVSGDCEEMYTYIYQKRGKRKAIIWIWKQVFTSMPLFMANSLAWGFIMFKNYLKITLRNLLKNRTYSFINLAGLSLGMACCLLILLWVQDELSYDRFHTNRQDIYRIISVGKNTTWNGTPGPLAPAIEKEIPEIYKTARTFPSPTFVLKYRDKAFYEGQGLFADPAILDIFSFPLLRGNAKTALSSPLNIVMSETMARKYFGNQDPMNKQINIEGRYNLKVSGILKDVPANSHLRFDFILPFLLAEKADLKGMGWGDFNFRTYIQRTSGADHQQIIKKINDVAIKHGAYQVVSGQVTLSLQSLEEMYLHPLTRYDLGFGNMKYVQIFLLIAAMILIIAMINFVNLSTARAASRGKEICLRKVVGAKRSQLFKQFIGESVFMSFISLLGAVLLVHLLIPLFNDLTGKNLVLDFFDINVIGALILLVLVSGALAGFYPALYLSSFAPVQVMKKNIFKQAGGKKNRSKSIRIGTLRKLLVLFQFSVSIALIICSLVVFDQLNFIRAKNWNSGKDLMIHVPVKENIGNKYQTFKNKLLSHNQVIDVTVKDSLPTILSNYTTGLNWPGKSNQGEKIPMETTRVGYDYFKTMNMKIVKGRAFSKEFPSDLQNAFVLNEKAVEMAGLKEPVGKMFQLYQKRGTIIGVVEDAHFKNLKLQLYPQVFHLLTDITEQAFFGSVFIKVRGAQTGKNLGNILAFIKSAWQEINSTAPFEYHFLNETLDGLYQNEKRLSKIITNFSLLAIFISCLGLFGLSFFLIEKRTKEIGIRKTLGASVRNMVYMLASDFSRWVVLANLIAAPLAWYAMNKWLQNFAYRTSISPWIFICSALAALTIALLTVIFQSLRAARANPVQSLRYE